MSTPKVSPSIYKLTFPVDAPQNFVFRPLGQKAKKDNDEDKYKGEDNDK